MTNRKLKFFNGKRLKQLRIKKGLSQTELGNMIGVTKAAICLYESEKRKPIIEMIMAFMQIFNISEEYLTNQKLFMTIENGELGNYDYSLITNDELYLLKQLEKDRFVYGKTISKIKEILNCLNKN